MGCDRVVLILSKPKNLFRQPGKDPSFAKRIERRYPKAAEQLRLRARRYNDGVDLAKLYEARGQVLIVSPDDTCGVDTLFEWDYRTDGFYWLDCYQENRCIYAICRKGKGEY